MTSVIILTLLPLAAARAGLAMFAPKNDAAPRGSVIILSLLPLAALQPEPRNHDRRQQERDHRIRNSRTLAEHAADDRTLIGQRRHQMGRVNRATARHRPDQLE